jgi:hypothetical protein
MDGCCIDVVFALFVFDHDSVFNTSSICPNHMCISSGNIRVIPDVDSLFAFVLFVGTLRVLSLVYRNQILYPILCRHGLPSILQQQGT